MPAQLDSVILKMDLVDGMFRYWAEWSIASPNGRIPYDDTPRDPIYIGSEPLPHSVDLIERCLAEMRQCTRGLRYVQFIEVFYFFYNRPVHIKLNIMRNMHKTKVSKDEFYATVRTGKEIAAYEIEQIMGRGQRPHKALKKKRETAAK